MGTSLAVTWVITVAIPTLWAWRLKTRMARAERLCRTDPLTGLLNRRGWRHAAERMITTAPVSLALVDIDRFKQINDSWGHPTGDNVLIAVADMLNDLGGVAGRLGGDEFAVLVPGNTNLAGLATAISTRDRRPATISVGLTHGQPDHRSAADAMSALLAEADTALYTAKRGGGNQVARYTRPPVTSVNTAPITRRRHYGPQAA